MRHALILFALVAGCSGTTGSALVQFGGAAGGPVGITPGQPYGTGAGFTLVLDRARLHLGALYLNQANPTSGRGQQACVQPGVYVGQLFGPLDLDLLSPALVPFPTSGDGTERPALSAEVWLLEGDIDAPDSQTPVLEVAGTATRGASTWPFTATITIGQNRMKPAPSLALPGANPICQQRIVSPIVPVGDTLTPTQGGTLTLRVDPRAMFEGVDFSLLGDGTTVPATPFVLPDQLGGISDQLFGGLRAAAGVYAITFAPE
jgi:hypothetical protein